MTSYASSATPVQRVRRAGFWTMVLGSIGIVYGDIGTSPLYAFKESIAHVGADGSPATRAEVLGVVSLMFWALMIIVTFKYVFLLMRFDNKGEGGTLSLMALAERAFGGRTMLLAAAGLIGAGLFYGDAMLTPAISVLSAVEGLAFVPGLEGRVEPYIEGIAIAVLVGLFLVQRHGTGGIGAWFGPICMVWFVTIGALGAIHIADDPGILLALSPMPAVDFLLQHSIMGFIVLGSVFLTVTGAEALYADMGHFGRKPIAMAWMWFVLPALMLNYLGQGAMALRDPATLANPFYMMASPAFRPWLVLLATAATIIASQAVISGAYSLTQQAIQLGLLPRLRILQTSDHHAGQIYMPQVNYLLMAGVIFLVVAFRTSSGLASAYGIAVIGTMITSSILAVIAMWKIWRWPLWGACALMSPFLIVEAIFLASNSLKIASGGFAPLMIATGFIIIMWTWARGSRLLSERTKRDTGLVQLFETLSHSPIPRVRGTAVFLTGERDSAPASLMHNLKHNQVLHENIIVLTVKTAPQPHVVDADIVEVENILPKVRRVTLTFGYRDTPNVSRALNLARKQGLAFDVMTTSFFVSRRALVASSQSGMPRWQDHLFIFLARNAADATDFFHIPASRVVELGNQVSV